MQSYRKSFKNLSIYSPKSDKTTTPYRSNVVTPKLISSQEVIQQMQQFQRNKLDIIQKLERKRSILRYDKPVQKEWISPPKINIPKLQVGVQTSKNETLSDKNKISEADETFEKIIMLPNFQITSGEVKIVNIGNQIQTPA